MFDRRAVVLACLALGACASASSAIKPLPYDEVLRRAAEESLKLETAQYTVDGTFDLHTKASQAQGNVRIDGVFADKGKQVQLQLDLTATYSGADGTANVINGTTEVIVAGNDAVYMKLDSLTMQPENVLIPPEVLGRFAGKWWSLPGQTPVAAMQAAPDPSLLRAQSDVVSVTSDHGIENLAGVPSYHYSVMLDPQKFVRYLSAIAEQKHRPFDATGELKSLESLKTDGELWIDATSFALRKVRWNLHDVPVTAGKGGTFDCAFTADVRNHNAAVKIVPPPDAKPFSPVMLLSEPIPENIPSPEHAVPAGQDATENLMDLINNQ